MLEYQIERTLINEIKASGGLALKLVSPSMNGLPDRLVLLPGGRCLFVELKAPGQKMRPLQLKRAEQLRELGFQVFCIDNIEDARLPEFLR